MFVDYFIFYWMFSCYFRKLAPYMAVISHLCKYKLERRSVCICHVMSVIYR